MRTKLIFPVVCFSVLFVSGLIFQAAIRSGEGVSGRFVVSGPYDQLWKKTDSLVAKGLTKSAQTVVEQIYKKAKAENNQSQLVKSLIYRFKLKGNYEENYLESAIHDLTAELKISGEPLKQVLFSLLAECYQTYYNQNRYVFLNRTETVDFSENDIKTWDLRKLAAKEIFYYNKSLQNSAALKSTPLNIFDDILIKQKNSRKFRPTLFDFLAHRAIDFFMNTESGLTEPVYKFEIDKPLYFSSTDDFVKLKFSTKDTFSLNYYALKIFQELIRFHQQDSKPDALIDAELKRLQFVNTNYVGDNKDSLYFAALQALEYKYLNFPASADISYELANKFYALGNQYDAIKAPEYKNHLKKAMKICMDAIQRFPESDNIKNCLYLRDQILSSYITVSMENANLPGQPALSLISYKNTAKVFYRISKLSPEKEREIQELSAASKIVGEYLKLPVLRAWSLKIPFDNDYQKHSTEVKIPELPAGFYVMMTSTDSSFSPKKGKMVYQTFWMTNISYVQRTNENTTLDFYVLNRKSGEPVPGVKATAWVNEYNYLKRKYELKKYDTYTTDNMGYFNIPESKNESYYKSFIMEFSWNGERYFTDNYFYQYKHYPTDKNVKRTYFFTDRAIYRPGQTVYFKGILTETNGDNTKILPNTPTTVSLYDVNWQVVEKKELLSNEYGSVNGTFTAPQGTLTGQMCITNGWGTYYFSVEEYKRPKFEASFVPVKGSYKAGENITVTGQATAYAGNNIDGAQVKYRIRRTARFPYRCWWWWYTPYSSEMEITNGETKTDESGKFSITFNAIPDRSVDKKYKPVFYYSVTADVTDINGETHSAYTSVGAGYTSLIAGIDIPERISLNDKNEYRIFATNLNNQPELVKGNIKIYKLKDPGKVYLSRKWEVPDKYTISKDEFNRDFPLFAFKDEDKPTAWAKDKLVLDYSFNTQTDTILNLNNVKWEQGYYRVFFETKDNFGDKIETDYQLSVFIPTSSSPADNNPLNVIMLKDKGEPGEKASLILGSKYKGANILYEIVLKDKVMESKMINLNEEQKNIDIPIKEEYRGNFLLNILIIRDNRSYFENKIITVPYTNKELDIHFSTFRNKLLPGQKEEWKITVKDKYGSRPAAEMLATLYDASLDAFRKNNWMFNLYTYNYYGYYWQTELAFRMGNSRYYTEIKESKNYLSYRNYDQLNWFGFIYNYYGSYHSGRSYASGGAVLTAKTILADGESSGEEMDQTMVTESLVSGKESSKNSPSKKGSNKSEDKPNENSLSGDDMRTRNGEGKDGDFSDVRIRGLMNETAFFYPDLKTDDSGNVVISFTIPEALTKWRMMGLAHTKDLKEGTIEKELVTQKNLMVVPNPPRFFRENDTMIFTAKVSNISSDDLDGQVKLEFFDAVTMNPVNERMGISNPTQPFSAKQGKSSLAKWKIIVPEGIGAISYRIAAKAGSFSDGEEAAIPVLTNRTLVTESLPLPINGNQTKQFSFNKLVNSGTSPTIKNFRMTLEFTSNPAWYAVQALPYLFEYPYECSEQTFSRLYANSIASYIINSSPKIKNVFDSWKTLTPDALLSNLEKNQELKSLMLEETPWVLEAKGESERKRRIALLFDLNKMANEKASAINKLQKMQTPNGGWAWFTGGPDDRYITQYIITGFAHLNHLTGGKLKNDNKVWGMVQKGVKYLDARIKEDYENIKKWYPQKINEDHIGNTQIQYLYARSYFMKDIEIASLNKEAFGYFKGQAEKCWLNKSRYMQGMIALALKRFEVKTIPTGIIQSLKENSLSSEEMGMYWRDNHRGYYWYEAPIEVQSLFIEAFSEVTNDLVSVEKMKIWLLKQKQTQDWGNTKATAEACYALLLRGTDLLASDKLVEVTLGGMKIDPYKLDDVKVEAGTGYFKTSWSGSEIKPEMGNITVTKTDDGVAWGAVYWQYFENLDKITKHETPLKLDKKLFVERNTPTGPVIEPVTEKTLLKVGDKIKVRIELRVDRDMEYVHMKDMRASAFEPVNVISRYKYQGGLGYYESTRDAATNFFFSYLGKGTYVFEYPMFVTHSGEFSNGITTIQCMYAPEFTSHSQGIRVKVAE